MPLLCLFVITFASCNNHDDDPTDPISQLPPMAQTGESSFGFLLNGKAVVVTNSSQMAAIYQGGLFSSLQEAPF
ncbi:hypothetical protein LX77_00851 [Gelidibacter algens]|uniref:Uncharacterized protein n=1 Tax=Gelidibacter algens TaxID=49280 RepID=A0A1A7R521_9FLAO|nr:hypothetical protein [Gelidibacter algens]OBX26569.1 hypothetical protein A9996_04565 [Gelidibacter algens]RAJ26597.1 hypothetical protein LX77_00851 [Gelidibacter algens]